MVDNNQKYVINIDFPTKDKGHVIHLNPYFIGLISKDKILSHYDPKEYKNPRDGGPVCLTKDEAAECLKRKRNIEWKGKSALSFRPCRLCMKLPEWDI